VVGALDAGGDLMRAPRATYRLQFRREFGFDHAASIASYLAKLGVSHVYASPYLRARAGSTHGYDIVAHDQLNPELGDGVSFARMHEAFTREGLGQILDFVPNHMGVGGADNPLWLEVLEWGPDSPFAGWFDIDWEPAARYLTEKLLVPVLDDQYGAALEDGKLELKFDEATGEFAVWAYDTHKLPICPLHYESILGHDQADLERLGDSFSAMTEWRPQIERRADELKRELSLLIATHAEAAESLRKNLKALNGGTDPTRRDLDALIQRQFWRASHFRVAGDDINYRRFFNVNELAGLRVELPEVFEHAHRLVVRLLREGVIDGIRIDHIDGLLDPAQYLMRLRALALDPQGGARPFYLVVEKILGRDERLRPEWQAEGTTGYEFGNQVLWVLTDSRGEPELTRAWQHHAGQRLRFTDVVREAKLFILENEMASELNVLARDTARVARQNARTADFTRNILRRALRATVACFPVYRTYLNPRDDLHEADRVQILAALAAARELERDVDPSVFDFLELLLTGTLVAAPRSGFSRQAALRCAMKFQQLSGPVMAKGLEDTAFYRFNRLISHNEVGGDPEKIGAEIAEFHTANLERARVLPHSMLGTSTHDTKRGEDVRARLATLAEIPVEWSEHVGDWRRILHAESEALADRNLEYFFYQTLLGSFPADETTDLDAFRQRLQDAMRKAAREARVHTTWARPNQAFEARLAAFIDGAFATDAFMDSFRPLLGRVARAGVDNSLLQTALKLTVPGVPDVYQGCELWDLSLVDPDNRRAVDYPLRQMMLERIIDAWQRDARGTWQKCLANWTDGAIKLLLTTLLLRLRAAREPLFAGGYVPCEVDGDARIVGAYLRRDGSATMLVAFARFPFVRQRERDWSATRVRVPVDVPSWRNVLTRESVDPRSPPFADGLPVAVWISD
jgi:(1->4)-alpha-D-glucan 1-alpha-D-glucosylmutase